MSIEINYSSRRVLVISERDCFIASVSAAAEQVGAECSFFPNLGLAHSAIESDPKCCVVVDYMNAEVFDAYAAYDLSFVSTGILGSVVVVPSSDFDAKFHAACMGASYVLTSPVEIDELALKLASVFSGHFRLGKTTPAKHRILAKRYLSLSKRQIQILPWIMRGESNKKIASRLSLGLRTVEQDRAAMIRQFEVNSIAELVQAVVIAMDQLS